MKELKLENTVTLTTIYKFGYLLIMVSLIIALIEFGSVVSGTNSVIQSNLFVHRYLDHFQHVQQAVKTNLQLEPLINDLNSVSNFLEINTQNFIGQIFIFIAAIIVIICLYVLMRKGFITNLELVHPDFPNETTYIILMTLVFSIGIAFYFSSTFIETSSTEIITQMISEVTTQNHDIKLALIHVQLENTTAAYNGAVTHETYFFSIFSFLAVGAILRQKSSFFSKSFFNASIIAILFWVFYYSRIITST